MWRALARLEVDTPYISHLKTSYADQHATVLTDRESDVFKTERGTKQGDP